MNIQRYLVARYLRYVSTFMKHNYRNERIIGNFYLYYRICDHGYSKVKPNYITKENCLRNALREFPLDKVRWIVYADNVCDETYEMICNYIPAEQVRRVKVGHGAGTFRMVYEEAIKNKPDDFVYFLEDDYLHLPGSYDVLLEAAKCNYTDYLTLYDHPDKYGKITPNPFIVSGGEKTTLYWCNKHHWKETNSTTMTFAAFVDVLIKDKGTFWRWTETSHPYDFQIFIDLKLFSSRKLSCAIPAMSTHGEKEYLSKGVEWHNIL